MLLIQSTLYHLVLQHITLWIHIQTIWMLTSIISPISSNWFEFNPIHILPFLINIVSLNILDKSILLLFTPKSLLEYSSDINSILFKSIPILSKRDSFNSTPLFVPSVVVLSLSLLFFNLLLNILFLLPNLISSFPLLFLYKHSSFHMDKKVYLFYSSKCRSFMPFDFKDSHSEKTLFKHWNKFYLRILFQLYTIIIYRTDQVDSTLNQIIYDISKQSQRGIHSYTPFY